MLYLQQHTNLFAADLRLLHFAPEPVLRRTFRLLPSLRYVTVDYAPTADARMDITRLAFPDHAFDCVLCVHVLEHIPDDRGAMRELHRVLKPGGWAILQVPLDVQRAETYEDPLITTPEDRRVHFGQEDHVRWYGRDYHRRLEHAGFQVTVDNYVRTLPAADIRRFGLSAGEDVYFCRKS